MKTEKRKTGTKALCRAAIIGALYAALTMAFGALAYGPFQIRPAEALCVLPLFYGEAVPGLYVGCLIANILSGYGVYDILLGSLATLLASVCTYIVGRIFKNKPLRIVVGGLFPVLLNSFIVPAIWLLAGSAEETYVLSAAFMLLTESVWIYALGTPLYIGIDRLMGRVSVLRPVESFRGRKEKRETAEDRSPEAPAGEDAA